MAAAHAAVSPAPAPARRRRTSPRKTRATRTPSATRQGRKKVGRGTSARKKAGRKSTSRKTTSRRKPAARKPTRKTPARKKTGRTPKDGSASTRPAASRRPPTRGISEPTRAGAFAARIRELEDRLRKAETDLAKAREQLLSANEQRDQLRLTLIQKEAELQRAVRRPAPPSSGVQAAMAGTHLDDGADSADEFALAYPAEPASDVPSEGASVDEEIAPTGDEIDTAEEDEDAGYDEYEEEADFLGPDGAILERRRQLDRERNERELELSEERFWMVCPRCGEPLSEHEFDSVKIERCEACGALCLDRGEIDLLLLMSADDRSLAYRTRGLLQ
jgi:hypothetical protein